MANNNLIQLVKTCKQYQLGETTIHALDHVDLQINKKEFVAIIGASGSGKSTLMNVASLLDNPTSGQVIFESVNTSKFSQSELAHIRNKKIGFIFQQFNLLPRMSAYENVQIPLLYANVSRSTRQSLAKEMLLKVGLGERLDNTPSQLSGGQQQRVAIARALINSPSVVFADEPTGNLDSKSGKEIMDILDSLYQEGTTIILVTHELEIAKHSNRIITMKDGKIISDKKNGRKKRK